MPTCDEAFDHRDDVTDGSAHARFFIWLIKAECSHIFVEIVDLLLGELEWFDAHFGGALDDLVVDISKIPYKLDRPPAVAEVAYKGVKGDHRSRVPCVTEVVHSHPTSVEPNVAGLERREVFHATGQSVVQPKRCRHGLPRDVGQTDSGGYAPDDSGRIMVFQERRRPDVQVRRLLNRPRGASNPLAACKRVFPSGQCKLQ